MIETIVIVFIIFCMMDQSGDIRKLKEKIEALEKSPPQLPDAARKEPEQRLANGIKTK